jgi:hypothetical protein
VVGAQTEPPVSDVSEAPKSVGTETSLTTAVSIRKPQARPKRIEASKSEKPAESAKPVDSAPPDIAIGSNEYGPPLPPVSSATTTPSTLIASASASVDSASSSAPEIPSVKVGDASVPIPSSSVSPVAAKIYPASDVKVRDVLVLRLKLADGGLSPEERAKRAKRAIEASLVESKIDSVRSELHGGRALLFIGNRPIVELTAADAEVMGEGSLELYTASAAAKVRDILENERRQSVVANSVLNFVLVGALAVGVVLALRLLSGLSRKAQRFIEENPERVPALHLRSIEVIRPHILRSGLVVGVGLLKLILQFALVYSWLVFTSSLFEATQGLADKLTSLVISPLAGLMTRLAALLPLFLVTVIAVAVLVVLLRFVQLFFAAVERRETELSWLRPELATPTSLMIRIGIVAASLLFLAPVVTGNLDGALSRLGLLFVVTIALASTPLLANVVVGLVTLYGARLIRGDLVQIGEARQGTFRGRVQSIGLIEIRLRSESGQEVRVAHLTALCRPMIVLEHGAERVKRALIVESEAKPERVVELLGQVISDRTLAAEIRILRIRGNTVCAELRLITESISHEQAILIAVSRALTDAEIRLVLAEWQDVT